MLSINLYPINKFQNYKFDKNCKLTYSGSSTKLEWDKHKAVFTKTHLKVLRTRGKRDIMYCSCYVCSRYENNFRPLLEAQKTMRHL